jgi:hypothetical protein
MSSWKDLYSEVKKRKMEALNKQNVVKAVEKHGKIIAVSGRYERPEKIIPYMYASEKKVIKPKDVMKTDLNHYDVVLIGCPGNEIPTAAHSKIHKFVAENGGWLITTDWAIRSIVEVIFPGFIKWSGGKTSDTVVPCQILEPNHPFLEGLEMELQSAKWGAKKKTEESFHWWLERQSFPITILNYTAVKVLISSMELQKKWGEAPVLVYFDYGKTNGRIIHLISHTHLQKGKAKGKYASAMILTNILDEKVSHKVGIKQGATTPQGYQDPIQTYYTSNVIQSEKISTTDSITPIPTRSRESSNLGGLDLTGTSKIIEVPNNFPPTQKCALGDSNFEGYTGKIYICKECGAPYHEECLKIQINEGICKICERILLW